ncbi:MAG: hypothetical protein ABW223_01955 [Rariglobus sp.]
MRLLLLLCVLTTLVRADFAQDLARIHTEAVGGSENVQALKTLRATGITRNARGDLHFTLWAGRPSQVRTELASKTRVITQAWGGGDEGPWSADSETKRITLLTGDSAEDFKTEAEFDDPLLAGKDRKIALDYVGEMKVDGRDLLKIMVTQNFTQISYVYLDPASYLIVRRDVIRRRPGGEMTLRTDYGDFRAVAGVLLPHRLSAYRDGKRLHETVIDRIEPNVKLEALMFATPTVESTR